MAFTTLCAFKAYPQDLSPRDSLIKSVEEYVDQVKTTWRIPGLSLSIVKDGEVILSKGYGVRLMGSDDEVTSSTIYQIGSISKSFTAAVVASLVDEGLVSWDDTVKNILPDFNWYDDYVEANMLVKDVMTHKTGIRGQAGTYIPCLGYDRDDVYKMMGLIKPAYQFRDVYAYNNITFLIAEKIIEKVTGKSWEENVQSRILTPLGMTSTSLNGEGIEAEGEKASIAHESYYVPDSMFVAPLYGEERALWWETVIGPAGSVNSNVEDMAKYALFHLNMGKVGDKQIISQKQMKYLHKGQTIVSQTDTYMRLYSHCWFVEQNNRYKLWFHTGTTWGFTAICAFVPELDLGLVVLCNNEAPSYPRYAIMRRVIDLVLGEKELKDYNSEYLAEWLEEEREDYKRAQEEQPKEIVPPPPHKAIVGKYTKDELFGDAEVTSKGGNLYITIGKKGWKHQITHVNGNEYTFRSGGTAFPLVFNMDEKGEKCLSLTVKFKYGEEETFGPWIKKR